MAVAPHTARFVRPHMSDVHPQLMSIYNTLWLYGLTTLFFQNIFGDHFLPFATIPKDEILGILFSLLRYPQDFFTNWSNLSSLPPTSVLIIHSLTVRFDHTFFPKHLWGSISAFCNHPQRFQSWGSFFCLLHYPQDFHQLVKPSSLGASLGGKLCRIMVKPYLAGRSPSSGWAVSPPQGSQHSSTTNIDPWNGCLLDRF